MENHLIVHEVYNNLRVAIHVHGLCWGRVKIYRCSNVFADLNTTSIIIVSKLTNSNANPISNWVT